MKNNGRNIFNDGQLVETVIMPVEIFKSGSSWKKRVEKRQWAEKVLADYVSMFHGRENRWRVISHINNSTGRVTGTSATFEKDRKQIVYMLLEPEKQPGSDGKYRVHILKAEYEPEKEASVTDTIVHKFEEKPFSCGLFEAARTKR